MPCLAVRFHAVPDCQVPCRAWLSGSMVCLTVRFHTVPVRFTLELCEPVQVQALEMGNLELFSSLPKSFDVHISDR